MGVLPLVIGPVAEIINSVIERVFPDADKQAEDRAKLLLAAQQIDADIAKGQMAINQVEAAHSSLFVAGWRPFIGWTCGAAFAYHYVLQPFISFAISNYTGKMVLLPAIDMEVVGFTITGMLGIAGSFRTIEKIKGVNGK